MDPTNLSCDGKYSSMSHTVIFRRDNPAIVADNEDNNAIVKFNVSKQNGSEDASPAAHSNSDFENMEDKLKQRQELQYSYPSEKLQSGKLGKWATFSNWLKNLKLNSLFYTVVLYILLPVWIWLSFFVLVGSDDLPGGTVFVIIILGCLGRLLGFGVQIFGLPPMLGMLGLGLIIQNVPYVDFGKQFNTDWSSPIRQTALAIILTRAGLNLDLDVLIRLKSVILRLAFCPTVLEAISVAVAANLILNFSWAWGFLLGFVLAPVSPAVVVPRLLALRESGFGVEKGIPTIIIAAASLDNVIAISLFGVSLGFAVSDSSLAYSILQGPLQIIIGLGYGMVWGIFNGLAFSPLQAGNNDLILVRALLTFGGGLISVIGFSKLGFSGGGALGCLLCSFTAACLWRFRGAVGSPDPLVWVFAKLWFVAEPLLFGVIGIQIDVTTLSLRTVYLGMAIIAIGSMVRFLTSYLAVTRANFNVKEKLFTSICWTPKATVQAAIGPISLEIARAQNKGHEAEELGQTVLTLAVLIILSTAIIGELGVMLTGERFLKKKGSLVDPDADEAGGIQAHYI